MPSIICDLGMNEDRDSIQLWKVRQMRLQGKCAEVAQLSDVCHLLRTAALFLGVSYCCWYTLLIWTDTIKAEKLCENRGKRNRVDESANSIHNRNSSRSSLLSSSWYCVWTRKDYAESDPYEASKVQNNEIAEAHTIWELYFSEMIFFLTMWPLQS